ncbi:hypothetical protein TNCV_2452021 [Trichonephila clavipes]|nr:hypothetical protein TNCV_2452021 [Trichonephila clavipes]
MIAVSVLEHFSDHNSIHQKLKKNTASVYSIAQLGRPPGLESDALTTRLPTAQQGFLTALAAATSTSPAQETKWSPDMSIALRKEKVENPLSKIYAMFLR